MPRPFLRKGKVIMRWFIEVYTWLVSLYVAALNTIYAVLAVISLVGLFLHLRRKVKGRPVERVGALFSLPVSLLVPAYNEEKTIVKAVRSFLQSDYPQYEVVVVNDGSTDGTLDVLIKEFALYPIKRPFRKVIATAPVRTLYYSRLYPNLVVVDKENGGKADALNAALNVAAYPYVCTLDADSVLERDALAKVMEPFFEERGRAVAVSGVVRLVNGTLVDEFGRVKEVHLPRSSLARLQIVEYFRAFLGARLGFSYLGSLLIASGAFAAFAKEAVVQAGGFSTRTVGEDMEIVVRLKRLSYQAGRPGKVIFVPDPIVWTQAPENLYDLSRQRRRWQRGLAEVIFLHRGCLFNPRYGVCGLFALPYQLLFELLGPVVEALGYVVVPVAWLFGLINTTGFWVFLWAEVFYGIFVSLLSVLYSELSEKRYATFLEFAVLVIYAVLENFGYRQLTVVWRLQGLMDALRRKRGWAKVERQQI